MSKILIQFDGSNFYNKVKKILPQVHLTDFNYAGLAYELAQTTDITKKSQSLYTNQQKLFTNLRNQNLNIKLGYLLMSSGVFHEKGVDIQIAVDIVRGAIKDQYDICYLISSDTDLIPAIQTAMDEGKKVVYTGFEHSISRALMKNCPHILF